MKNKLFTLALLLGSLTMFSQTPCVGGSANGYPCSGYDLQSHIPLATFNSNGANDSWGWTDPQDGTEYALVGLENGTAFIDISDPINPVYLGKLPTATSSSTWRDMKVYNNYVFVVSEASGHGIQIFDLTNLRNVTNPPVTFTEDASYNGFSNAHNIVINEDTGFAYAVGTNTFGGGAHFVDISNPLNPVAAGGFGGDGYTHDAQVVTYCGPDPDYAGREIYIGSNGSDQVVSIVDVTNKSNPQSISTLSYSNVGYTHQGWFTEDQTYFLLGDEFDESNVGFDTRTVVFDLTDLDNPVLDFEYFGPTTAIDHNGYVHGNRYYLANYAAGLREIDVTDIANGVMTEVGYFDTYTSNDAASYNGVWNVYPYFESGNIMINDRSGGFFLVKAQNFESTPPTASCMDATVEIDANGVATLTAAQIDDGSSDNGGNVGFILCKNSFDCSEIGTNQVELEVYDDYGNRDFCTATVTVEDNINPTLNCPGPQSAPSDGSGTYVLPDYGTNGTVTAIDNCTQSFTITQTPAAGTALPEGVYTIMFETTDSSGNPASCSFELTITEAAGISDAQFAQSISIVPNPASVEVTITSEIEPLENITISDISGKILLQHTALESQHSTINLSALSQGIYFITLNNKATKKIIKQ